MQGGGNKRFTVERAMSCKKGDLLFVQHKDVAAEWHHLCAQLLQPLAVSNEPLIHADWGLPNAGNRGLRRQLTSMAT
jgi:hypothetical protein